MFSKEVLEEIKDLLWLFGVPYVEAPFEAESQCAFLERIGLVDGVVTEDSDALLFGANTVYKNIFNNKFVQMYKSSFIHKDLGLSWHDLIWLALFLGSDYTLGVKGIGPVNAIEIIQSFPGMVGLQWFKNWADKSSFEKEDESFVESEKEYIKRHQGYKKHWEFPSAFPSE